MLVKFDIYSIIFRISKYRAPQSVFVLDKELLIIAFKASFMNMCDRVDTVKMKWADTVALTRQDYQGTRWIWLHKVSAAGCDQWLPVHSCTEFDLWDELNDKTEVFKCEQFVFVLNCTTAHVDHIASVYTMLKYPLRYRAGCGMRAQL